MVNQFCRIPQGVVRVRRGGNEGIIFPLTKRHLIKTEGSLNAGFPHEGFITWFENRAGLYALNNLALLCHPLLFTLNSRWISQEICDFRRYIVIHFIDHGLWINGLRWAWVAWTSASTRAMLCVHSHIYPIHHCRHFVQDKQKPESIQNTLWFFITLLVLKMSIVTECHKLTEPFPSCHHPRHAQRARQYSIL